MKVLLSNSFHGTTVEFSFSAFNRKSITLSGKQLRRLLSELCVIEGCGCSDSTCFSADGTPVEVLRFAPDADDDETALELKLPSS